MIKLQKIITEALNTFSVEMAMKSNRKYGLMGILDEIRAVQKITIVQNITPTNDPRFGKEKYISDKVEYTLLKVKWVTRTNPKEDLKQFSRDMLVTTDLQDTGIRIPGILSLKFKEETLTRVDY
tara:strand:+ start:83 stop:454 length:372 start_codon:yes stop_codon:yes gene_type:complete